MLIAPFQWAAIFHKSSIIFTKGVEGLSFYSSGSKSTTYELPTKVSCVLSKPYPDVGCGCYSRSRLTMEEMEKGICSSYIFYSQRAIDDILDGKPKWSTMDGEIVNVSTIARNAAEL
ncbi:hypothetical protein P175DRAFT_0557855 [Aspergillus ochraceoroseus IBT 24754]|uniref:Uncharacterized protein n=1 Tax=Aspergillus ochraceoroseus IBT 24754 TaxID=1392256 RepID=A0A2T5LY24_9EURO|nr:uncharacterized protein P175DRAFT_0557855 [Aspergillus ochraceoroseus IBT 24754]PTU21185.1 hypothetical protein P175DRAFT_0557855 [Aspergillus ochraceoroseus IBT 24754]